VDLEGSVGSGVAHRASRTPRAVGGVIVGVAALMVLADLIQAFALTTGRVLTTGGANPRLSLDAVSQLLWGADGPGMVDALVGAGSFTRFLYIVPSLLHATVITVATLLLLQIMHGIAVGKPFSETVLRRWKELAAVLVGGAIAQMVADIVAAAHLSKQIGIFYGVDRAGLADPAPMLRGDFSPVGASIPVLIAGLLAIGLTSAFRAGARLAEAADGLI